MYESMRAYESVIAAARFQRSVHVPVSSNHLEISSVCKSLVTSSCKRFISVRDGAKLNRHTCTCI